MCQVDCVNGGGWAVLSSWHDGKCREWKVAHFPSGSSSSLPPGPIKAQNWEQRTWVWLVIALHGAGVGVGGQVCLKNLSLSLFLLFPDLMQMRNNYQTIKVIFNWWWFWLVLFPPTKTTANKSRMNKSNIYSLQETWEIEAEGRKRT
jgi:hypothetical protein